MSTDENLSSAQKLEKQENTEDKEVAQKLDRDKKYDLVSDIMVSISGIIKIFADNPPTVLIAGALILLLAAPGISLVSQNYASLMTGYVPFFLFGGIGLQVLWLFKDKINESFSDGLLFSRRKEMS